MPDRRSLAVRAIATRGVAGGQGVRRHRPGTGRRRAGGSRAVGIDAAKDVRRATAVAADGCAPLDREVANTGAAIVRLTAELAALGAAGGWPASTRSAAPPRSRRPRCSTAASGSCTYIPGLTVNRARRGTVAAAKPRVTRAPPA